MAQNIYHVVGVATMLSALMMQSDSCTVTVFKFWSSISYDGKHGRLYSPAFINNFDLIIDGSPPAL